MLGGYDNSNHAAGVAIFNDFHGTTFENQMTDGQFGSAEILRYSPGSTTTLVSGGLYFLHTNGYLTMMMEPVHVYLASFVLVLAGIYVLQTLKEPDVFDFRITEDSLQINQKQVFYKDLRGFFVDHLSKEYQVLHLIPNAKRYHESTIQLFNLPEQKIVSLLKLRVPILKDANPSLLDRIVFLLKI